MRVGQHRIRPMVDGAGVQRVDHGSDPGNPHFVYGRPDGQGISKVVDVFTRAGEVCEFRDTREPKVHQTRANVVLDCFHVVSGAGLEGGQLIDVGLPEVGDQRAESTRLRGVEMVRSEQFPVGEIQQPFDLNPDTSAVESRLGKVLTEPADGGTIATVERAERLFWQGVHEGNRRIPGSIWRNSAALAFSIMPSTLSNMAASE